MSLQWNICIPLSFPICTSIEGGSFYTILCVVVSRTERTDEVPIWWIVVYSAVELAIVCLSLFASSNMNILPKKRYDIILPTHFIRLISRQLHCIYKRKAKYFYILFLTYFIAHKGKIHIISLTLYLSFQNISSNILLFPIFPISYAPKVQPKSMLTLICRCYSLSVVYWGIS